MMEGRKWQCQIGLVLKLLILATLFALGEGTCGNGIVEDQEECDCGSALECQDPCCRALVCTLKEGAECSNLTPCCKNCKFKRKWDLCRSASNECDLPEYCTGSASNCPPNIFQREGKNCSNDQGYCFKGYCLSHEEQCKLIFPSKGVASASPECYRHLNQMGNEHGHCGSGTRACTPENAQCGTLQCRNVNVMDISGSGVFTQRNEFDEDEEDHHRSGPNCPIFGTTTPLKATDFITRGPLVQDRTKCGNMKICLNQQCVNMSSVISPVGCPTSLNGTECSQRGDCTSRASCLCHIGWGGKDCSQPEEIVEVKYLGTTMRTLHDIPVTRTESQGIITHKHPELEEYTTYTLGMIFAVVVVSVSIICFMVALVYCYFFSSPIAKAKENLDSQIDEYTLDNSGPLAQQLTQPSKLSSSPSKMGSKVIISTSPEMNGRISSVPKTAIHCNDPSHSQLIKAQQENRVLPVSATTAVTGEVLKSKEDVVVELSSDVEDLTVTIDKGKGTHPTDTTS